MMFQGIPSCVPGSVVTSSQPADEASHTCSEAACRQDFRNRLVRALARHCIPDVVQSSSCFSLGKLYTQKAHPENSDSGPLQADRNLCTDAEVACARDPAHDFTWHDGLVDGCGGDCCIENAFA